MKRVSPGMHKHSCYLWQDVAGGSGPIAVCAKEAVSGGLRSLILIVGILWLMFRRRPLMAPLPKCPFVAMPGDP